MVDAAHPPHGLRCALEGWQTERRTRWGSARGSFRRTRRGWQFPAAEQGLRGPAPDVPARMKGPSPIPARRTGWWEVGFRRTGQP